MKIELGKERKDPLTKDGPPAGKELIERYIRQSQGFPPDAVISAGMGMVLAALRNSCKTKQEAERVLAEIIEKSGAKLLEHYDGTGKRKSIFPHHQTIVVPGEAVLSSLRYPGTRKG